MHGFAYGLPLITTKHGFHSPEIEYLSDKNGVITKHDIFHYAEAMASIISSPQQLETMKQAASTQADELQLTSFRPSICGWDHNVFRVLGRCFKDF